MAERVLHRSKLLRAERRPESLRLLVVCRRHFPGAGGRAACGDDLLLGRLDERFACCPVLVVRDLVGVLVLLLT